MIIANKSYKTKYGVLHPFGEVLPSFFDRKFIDQEIEKGLMIDTTTGSKKPVVTNEKKEDIKKPILKPTLKGGKK